MDDSMRAALRALVRRAEWDAARGEAEAGAQRLNELGRELASRLAAGQEDEETWAHRAVASLAAHCGRATPSWSVDDVAELARLREAALIALAPAPGQTDAAPRSDRAPVGGLASARLRLPLPHGRRAGALGIVAAGCAVLVAVIVADNRSDGSPPVSVSSAPGPAPAATASAFASATVAVGATTTAAGTGQPAGLAGATASSPATVSALGSTASAEPSGDADTARVTAIQMTATAADGYPEVQIYGTITASGTGSLGYEVAVAGTSGAPRITTESESGQTSYALSQSIYLQPWCGQKSVTVTVSSGSVSRSASVPVSGC